ncbi:MAG: M23 family metallopeptidase [Clostridiaceae bacterium]|jgi:murein DD-endopeptidase MepM/ murein hydrolase activator NlpD|nr:M23 family metallopeptidase [Clostridiaceae bacterium]
MRNLRGKMSARRKYLSIMYIPHHKGGVKTIRISHYRTILLTAFAFMLVALLALTGYTLSVVRQNNDMIVKHAEEINDIMSEKEQLQALIAKQAKELADNAEIITTMQSIKTISEEAIDDYKEQYENMIVAYIDKDVKNIGTISRGDKKPSSFKEDVAELRALISLVESAKLSEDDVTSKIAQKEARLNNYLDALPTYWPVNSRTIFSGFGMRFHPIYKRYRMHDGLDMAGSTGDPVYASGEGKVIFAGWNGGFGNVIIIDHGNGFKTYYAHLSKILVKEGQWVSKAQKIGHVGSTGLSTSSHLHFEVRLNEKPTDPLYYIEP